MRREPSTSFQIRPRLFSTLREAALWLAKLASPTGRAAPKAKNSFSFLSPLGFVSLQGGKRSARAIEKKIFFCLRRCAAARRGTGALRGRCRHTGWPLRGLQRRYTGTRGHPKKVHWGAARRLPTPRVHIRTYVRTCPGRASGEQVLFLDRYVCAYIPVQEEHLLPGCFAYIIIICCGPNVPSGTSGCTMIIKASIREPLMYTLGTP